METRYLVPLDGSELSEHTLPWARLLAEKTGRKVELLRCHDPLASVFMMPEFAAPAALHVEAYYKEIDEYLAAQAEYFADGQAVTVRWEGEPAHVILDRCDKGDIDTVLLASHGRGGLGRWLLGSVATKVVRGSRTPVLVVNATTQVPEVPRLERILVPLDGSELSEAALPRALKLARLFGAALLLYRAIPHTRIGNPQLNAAIELERENAEEYLQQLKKAHPDVEIETSVEVSGPNLGIAGVADSCDLVVMGSHGRSGVKRWLLGSVTEKLIQALNKPLLIVYRRDNPDDEAE